MNTRDDIFTQVLVRNNRTTTDGFITDAYLQKWYKDANNWANSYHKWPFTEGKASTTYTTAVTDDIGSAIIPYPEGWKADSIRMLTIGGKRMTKLDFTSFQRFLERNSSNSDRVYSDYARQIYVNVNADVSGSLVTYGQFMPAIDVTDEVGITSFSGYDEEGNEAIYEKMSSFLKRREHLADEAELHDQRATAKLDELWKRIQDEQYGYQTRDQNMYADFDVIRGQGSTNDNWNKPNQWI